MRVSILMHLPRGNEEETTVRVSNVVGDMLKTLQLALVRLPEHCVPSALRDLESDEILCVQHEGALNPAHLQSLQWAAHHRYRKVQDVRKQLRCDVLQLDESRIEKGWKAARRRAEKRPKKG